MIALDASVLRPPFFGEVAARQKLDARDDRLIHHLRDQVNLVQHAVDAEPHERRLPLGLEVNVRGTLLERVAQDVIKRFHDRRGGGVEFFRFGGEKFLISEIDVQPAARELCFSRLQAGFQPVERAVQRLDVAARGDDALHIEAGDAPDVVAGERRQRIVYCDGKRGLAFGDRDQAVAPGERTR